MMAPSCSSSFAAMATRKSCTTFALGSRNLRSDEGRVLKNFVQAHESAVNLLLHPCFGHGQDLPVNGLRLTQLSQLCMYLADYLLLVAVELSFGVDPWFHALEEHETMENATHFQTPLKLFGEFGGRQGPRVAGEDLPDPIAEGVYMVFANGVTQGPHPKLGDLHRTNSEATSSGKAHIKHLIPFQFLQDPSTYKCS